MNESFQAKLLMALKERLGNAVPELQWIAQDFGQLEYFDLHPSVTWPCVLIDFPITNFDTEGYQSQWADTSIILRLAFSPYEVSNNVDEIQEKSLEYWQMETNICKALHNWQPVDENSAPLCNPLMHMSSTTEKRDNDYLLQLYFLKDSSQRRENPIRVRNILFTTSYEENNLAGDKGFLPPLPAFDIN